MLRCLPIMFFICAVASGDDWPTWQHDNRRTGASPEELAVSRLASAWEWRSPVPPVTAWHGPAKWDAYAYHRNLPSMRSYDNAFHVIAVGDSVWFGSSVDDSLYCLDAASGKQRWTYTADAPIRLAASWSDGCVYFGADDGFARCLDATSGALLWKSSPSSTERRILNNGRFIHPAPCRTGVVIEDGRAWFANSMLPWQKAWLSCVDAETGLATGDDHFVREMSGTTVEGAPALSREFLVLPQGRVAPRLFRRDDGTDQGEMVKSGGGSVVVVSLDEEIIHGPATDSRKGGFRRSSGESREVIAGLGRGNALVVDGGLSWMLTDTDLVCSEMRTGKVLWKKATNCPCSLAKAGGTIFAGGVDEVHAYSAADGALLWTADADGRVFSMAVANGRLFATTDCGVVHCFAPSTEKDVVSTDEKRSKEPSQRIPGLKDDDLISHWVFDESSIVDRRLDARVGDNVTLSAPPSFSRIGRFQALELDGKTQSVMVAPEYQSAGYPDKEFTATAWVRLDQPQEWGGIVGIVQDDGAIERGWLLGYRKNRFSIAVATKNGPSRLLYVTSQSPFEVGRWYQVLATYDGDVLSLFVDGELAGRSKLPSGPIVYPERAWYEIGAYHDKDEYFRMRGGVQEVVVYRRALTASDVARSFRQAKKRFPAIEDTMSPLTGPYLTFTSPAEAEVRWTTAEPQPSLVSLTDAGRTTTFSAPDRVTDHRMTISGLRHNRTSAYRIGQSASDGVIWTRDYECDTFFNFTSNPTRLVEPLLWDKEGWPESAKEVSESNGLGVLYGDFSAEEVLAVVGRTRLRYVLMSSNEEHVSLLRRQLLEKNCYGHRIAVMPVQHGDQLPIVGACANLVIAKSPPPSSLEELKRVVRPNGGRLFVTDESGSLELRLVLVREELAGAADWTHLYGTPDNSAFAGEKLGGATRSAELNVQWVGRPGPRYQADRSGRKPSPLVADGRMFLQGLDRIIAVDVFNGSILWAVEIPGIGRFNVPRDCGNWCATDRFVFLVVNDRCWKLSAKTGAVLSQFHVSDDATTHRDWGFVATAEGLLYGSDLPEGTSWSDFWGDANAGWYDARAGEVTYPICSDRLFCRNSESGELKWEYQRGVVLNSTVTISDGTMYFVESRSESVLNSSERRVGDPKLWEDLHLVAVDARTGSPKWERRLSVNGPQVVSYLAHSQGQLTFVTSADAEFQVSSFGDENGDALWTTSAPWDGGKGDHGKAMMRPAISGDRIFLRPHVLSLADGRIRKEKMPDGHGCGTYACTDGSVVYRAKTVTMWSPEDRAVSTWDRLRPDCWLSTIPANGMLLSPEGGGGCSCGSWMETSIGFLPAVFDPLP